jgi:ABC-type lipoprotein release transport system permease subunit
MLWIGFVVLVAVIVLPPLFTRYLGSLLFGVKPVDVVAFGAMSAMMIAMGMLASYIPARRASSVDPMEALRSD